MRITEKKLFMFYKRLLREDDMKFSFGWNQAFIDIGSVNTTGWKDKHGYWELPEFGYRTRSVLVPVKVSLHI